MKRLFACHATFGTNDKKVLSPIFPQCLIFLRSTWPSQLMNVLLIIILTIYIRGLQQVEKWNSCGLDYIHLEQECGLLIMVENIASQTPA
jgi:hypothetical protein